MAKKKQDVEDSFEDLTEPQGHTMEQIMLYNRNPYPVTVTLYGDEQMVLSPNQKTEPLNADLLLDLPIGVVKLNVNI